MVTVGVVAVRGRAAAGGGAAALPGVRGPLAGWGHARERVIRGAGGVGWRLRPRRSRCGGCGVTHVLLPVSCLLRRADGVAVIWAALAARRRGGGSGRSRPGWAGRRRRCGTGWPGSPRGPGRSAGCSRRGCALWMRTRRRCCLRARRPRDAVAAVTAAAAAAGRRWAARLVSVSPGELASSVSGGRLLAPGFGAGVDQHESGLGARAGGPAGCGEARSAPLSDLLEVR